MRKNLSIASLAAALLLAVCLLAVAADESAPAPATQPAAAAAPATQPAAGPASAEQVLDQMLGQMKSPVVEPTHQPADSVVSPSNQVDTRLLGVAPGAKVSDLRREGEFVTSRRGRLLALPNGAGKLFVFDADTMSASETPMFLMPCQALQEMEEIVARQGENTAFIVTGQIFSYRGANYLLPTMMKVAVDKGNLQH